MNYKHYAAKHNRRRGQKPSPIIPVANYSWVNLDIYADLSAFPYSGRGPTLRPTEASGHSAALIVVKKKIKGHIVK